VRKIKQEACPYAKGAKATSKIMLSSMRSGANLSRKPDLSPKEPRRFEVDEDEDVGKFANRQHAKSSRKPVLGGEEPRRPKVMRTKALPILRIDGAQNQVGSPSLCERS
jgi:hypothetical protein